MKAHSDTPPPLSRYALKRRAGHVPTTSASVTCDGPRRASAADYAADRAELVHARRVREGWEHA